MQYLLFKHSADKEAQDRVADFMDFYNLDYTFSFSLGKPAVIVHQQMSDEQLKQALQLEDIAGSGFTETSYVLASRHWKAQTSFDVNGIPVGGQYVNIIAGPCAVESEGQIETMAAILAENNVKFMRGGAFKPRSSPYTFQGLEKEGLKLLRKAADRHGLAVVTEVMELSHLDTVYEYADILQVGTRNMMNYAFLKELGKIKKPVLLKRGMSAKVEEWLLAAEYILLGGNEKVILCERGIRSYDNATRNVLDIAAIALAKELSHLPVFADPSQGTGKRSLIAAASRASVAAGADGLIIEMHQDPEHALSDGPQSIYPAQFQAMLPGLSASAAAVNRSLDMEHEFGKKRIEFN